MATYTGSAPYSLYADFKVDLSVKSQSQTGNYSTIAYRIYLQSVRQGSGESWTERPVKLIADGKTVVDTTATYDFDVGESYTLASGEFQVKHNANGAKYFDFTATAGTHKGDCYLKSTMTLPTIEREFGVNVVDSSGQDLREARTGDMVRVKVVNPTGIAGNVFAIFEGDRRAIGSAESSTIYFTIPSEWAGYFSDTSPKDLTFRVTSSDGQRSGSQIIALRATSIDKPTITSVSISDTNSSVSNVFGNYYYYTDLSNIRADVYATAPSGASLKIYKASLGGRLVSSSTSRIDIGKIKESGNIDIEFEVIDSRGLSNTYTKSIFVREYKPPSASIDYTERQGSTISARVSAFHTVSPGSIDNNTMRISVSTKPVTSSYYTDKYSANVNVENFNQDISLGSGYDNYSSYDVKVVVKDKFNSYTALKTVASDNLGIVIDKANNNIGVGKMPDTTGSNKLNLAGDITCSNIACEKLDASGDASMKNLSLSSIDASNYKYLSQKISIVKSETTTRKDTITPDGKTIREVWETVPEINNISYPYKTGNGNTYTDIMSISISKHGFYTIDYINVFVIGSSGAGTHLSMNSYSTSQIKYRLVDVLGASLTSRVNLVYYIRGSI